MNPPPIKDNTTSCMGPRHLSPEQRRIRCRVSSQSRDVESFLERYNILAATTIQHLIPLLLSREPPRKRKRLMGAFALSSSSKKKKKKKKGRCIQTAKDTIHLPAEHEQDLHGNE
eukprot:TRINITY_DN9513_c0_g4_i3.p1 TRINITY_DN9513_c0_g4~~TRINITY_DN9513_c0_g4_i3.p1  ORF type:complete len:115 (-),score=9.78 TRINITY_DN9513_c0_g4_i3:91-435(-)